MADVKETAHITAVQTQWWLKQQAAKAKHFSVVDGEFVPYTVNAPMFDLAATVAAVERQQKEAHEKLIANAEIGQMIKGEGVFLGTWRPHDEGGHFLGPTFNVFAAPQDIAEDAQGFLKTVRAVEEIKDLCGHDGGFFARDTNLYHAIKNGNYHGEWFIPPKELLDGFDNFTGSSLKDNLFDHQNKGALKGSFNTVAGDDNPKSTCYWSSSIDRFNMIYNADFASLVRCWSNKDMNLRCRVVRLAPKA